MSYYNVLTPPTVPVLFNQFPLPWLPQGNPTQAVAATFFGPSRLQESAEAPPPLLDLSTRLLEVHPTSFPEAPGHDPEILTQEVPNAATGEKVGQAAQATTGQNNPEKTPRLDAKRAAKQRYRNNYKNDPDFRAKEVARAQAYRERQKAEDFEGFHRKHAEYNKAYRQFQLKKDPESFHRKQAEYHREYRKRQLEEDPQGYLAKQAEYRKTSRERRKEKSAAAAALLSLSKKGEEKAPV